MATRFSAEMSLYTSAGVYASAASPHWLGAPGLQPVMLIGPGGGFPPPPPPPSPCRLGQKCCGPIRDGCTGICAPMNNTCCFDGETWTSCPPGVPCCGSCGVACLPTQLCCGAQCVDPSSNNNNCGSCGIRCLAGQICCNGHCVSENQNCGGCGTRCLAGQICCNGKCVPSDLNQNCGTCTNVCGAGQTCCGGACVTMPCPSGQSLNCYTKMCQPSCPPGYKFCGGVCILATDICCNSIGISCDPTGLHGSSPAECCGGGCCEGHCQGPPNFGCGP